MGAPSSGDLPVGDCDGREIRGNTVMERYAEPPNRDSPTIQGTLQLKQAAASYKMKTQLEGEQAEVQESPQRPGDCSAELAHLLVLVSAQVAPRQTRHQT